MTRKWFVLVGLVGILALASGCAGPSRVEMDYGTSYKLALFNQVLNPEAEKNLEPVTGFNGGAAQNTLERYQKDFEKPAPRPVYMVPIGTLGR